MKKKMDLESFDVFKYIKYNFFGDQKLPYLLVNSDVYKSASIRFPHRNFFYGVGLTFSGKSKVTIANQDFVIQKGSLILIGPGVLSQWSGNSDAPTETILFTEELFNNLFRSSFLPSFPFFLPGGNHVINLNEADFEKMQALFAILKQFEKAPEIVRGITYSIIQLSKTIHDAETKAHRSTFSRNEMTVRAFNSLVAKNFLKNKDVGFYAEALNLSPKHLSEVLLSELGRPAKTLIDDVVFLEAKSLLRQTTMSVQEIALWLGYSDTSYFAKAFKARESCTPLEYRKK